MKEQVYETNALRTKRQLRQCEWGKIWEIPKDGKNK